MNNKAQWNSFEHAVYRVLKQHDIQKQHVLLGVSGGVDSVVLLECLSRLQHALQLNLTVGHVHHGRLDMLSSGTTAPKLSTNASTSNTPTQNHTQIQTSNLGSDSELTPAQAINNYRDKTSQFVQQLCRQKKTPLITNFSPDKVYIDNASLATADKNTGTDKSKDKKTAHEPVDVNVQVVRVPGGPLSQSEADLRQYRHQCLQQFCHFTQHRGQDQDLNLKTNVPNKSKTKQLRNSTLTIALAHHQNDLIETRVMRLLRGTGLQGLKAMQVGPSTPTQDTGFATAMTSADSTTLTTSAESATATTSTGSAAAMTAASKSKTATQQGVALLRPLLQFSKQQILQYAHARGLKWLDDPCHNNFRHWLRGWLSTLEEKKPGSTQALGRSLQLLAEGANSLADSTAANKWPSEGENEKLKNKNLKSFKKQSFLTKEASAKKASTAAAILQPLSRAYLLTLNPAEQRQHIAHYMWQKGLRNYTAAHINEVIKHLQRTEKNFEFKLLKHKWQVTVEGIQIMDLCI